MLGRDGGPGGIRTPDLPLRRRPLYPAELRARLCLDCRMRVATRIPPSAIRPTPCLRPNALRQDFLDYAAVNVRQSEVASGVPVGQLRVVESELVEDRSVQVV